MTASTYTPEEDARILASRVANLPWAQVSEEMGRSVGALQGRYKQLRSRAALGRPPANPLRDPDTLSFPQRCADHAAAILAASPRGFPALSEKRVGRGGLAACLPLVWPLDRL